MKTFQPSFKKYFKMYLLERPRNKETKTHTERGYWLFNSHMFSAARAEPEPGNRITIWARNTKLGGGTQLLDSSLLSDISREAGVKSQSQELNSGTQM